VENEFASENIDKQTLENHEGEILDIAGDCICCSSGQELEEAFKIIAGKKWARPVIIETTGVASSVQLIQKIFLNDVFLDKFRLVKNIFVVDPLEINADNFDSTKRLDALLADLIIINKTDLADERKVAELERRLRIVNPKADLFKTTHADVNPSIVSLAGESGVENALAENFDQLKNAGVENHGVTYFVYEPGVGLDKEFVEKALLSLPIKRAKGFFIDPLGQWWHLEATGFHKNIEKIGAKERPVIVFIGPDIDGEAIKKAFNQNDHI
jgi:G3E family GTPase